MSCSPLHCSGWMLSSFASSSLHALGRKPAPGSLHCRKKERVFLSFGYGVTLAEKKGAHFRKSGFFNPFCPLVSPIFPFSAFPFSSLAFQRSTFSKAGDVEATDTMAGCFWHGRRKSKTNLGINGLSPTIEPKDEVKDENWFDSRLVFESDSDDDFKSVNGDSLPSSFGHSYSNPGTPRATFASLKERMESAAPQNGVDGTHTAPRNEPTSPEERKTLKELFTYKPDAEKKPESENTQLVSRQSSRQSSSKDGQLHDKASQKSCLPGLLSSVGINMKKSPSSPEPNKSKTMQPRLPFRLCAS